MIRARHRLWRIWQLLPERAGAVWVLIALAVPKLFGAVLTLGLRRYLGPGASGLFDLAYAPYQLLDNFRSFGTGPALVYEETLTAEVANTAWTLNMAMAVLITVVAQLLAAPIAHYYGHPHIEGIFRGLSIAYVFASISSVHSFLLLRARNFRARAVPPVIQVFAAGGVALLFAVWGFGLGLLVARELTSVIVGSILFWVIYPFRPRVQFVPALAWRLFRYGVWIGAGLVILFLSQNVDVFIGGRIIHRASDVGFYTTSWNLAFIAAGVFTLVSSSMVFPTLSRLQGDPGALRTTLLKAIRQTGLLMFPAAALLAVVAPVIIVPLLGASWMPYRKSYLVLSLLAIYAGNRTMLSIFFEGYKSVGKPWIVPIYNLFKLAIMVPAMVFGAQHGILGLALTYIPVQMLEIPAGLMLAERVLHLSPVVIWKAARLPILATATMLAVVAAAEISALHLMHWGDLPTLVLCLALAAIVYPGTLTLLDRAVLTEARGVLLKGL